MLTYQKFDSQNRATARNPEALALNQNASLATLLAGLPALLTQLNSDLTAWAGNPTTYQAELAVSDARAIETVFERIHSLVHKARGGV